MRDATFSVAAASGGSHSATDGPLLSIVGSEVEQPFGKRKREGANSWPVHPVSSLSFDQVIQ